MAAIIIVRDMAEDHQPTGAAALGGRALHDAASAVAAAVVARIGDDGWSVLVTSDDQLAESDAAYLDVMIALEHLRQLADDALRSARGGRAPRSAAIEVAAAAKAVGKVVPGVLSLLTAQRTVTTGTLKAWTTWPRPRRSPAP